MKIQEKSIPFFVLTIMFLLLSMGKISADTYYVDRNHASANNSNPGTLALPWLTIQHAAETLTAGDTVFIRSGVYSEQVLTTQNGNANDGHIVFAGYPNEVPVIDGAIVTTGGTGITISNGYIEFIGFEIINWETGIWTEYAEFIEISDCEVHECFYGIGMSYGTHDFVLNNVLLHHFDLYGFDASPGGGLDCYNGTFNDCVSHTGRDQGQNVDGFALGHGTQHNFVFNRCITYNVYDGFDISSAGTTLIGCLAYNCWNGGYKLWQDDVKLINCIGYGSTGANVEIDWDNEPGKTTLFNCTFFNGQTFNVWVESSNDTLLMYNCIIAGGDNIGLAFELPGISNYHGNYNLFHNDNPDRTIAVAYTNEFSLQQIQNGEWTTYSGQDNNSLVVTDAGSIFIDALNNNLHLSPNSPAIDAGTGTGAPSIDFDGNPRPSGQGYDLGAYEFQAGTGVGDNNFDFDQKNYVLFQNYPNPFNPVTIIKYKIPELCFASLKVFDVLGKEIQILVSKEMEKGNYEISFNADRIPSGIYFYRIEAKPDSRHTGYFSETKKMVLLR